MPKRVDHDARRRQIADALLRAAAARGLHATGFREVAAEAGVSVRLVQYYFETKEQLLLSGLRRLGEQFADRVAAATPGSAAGPAPGGAQRARIEQVLLVTMPLDDDSRGLYVVYNQYFALALTEPALAAQPYTRDPDILGTWLADRLRDCQSEKLLGQDLAADDEATALLALTAGLGNAVLAGTRSPGDARRVLAHHLDRLFRPGRAAPGTDQPTGWAGPPK